MTRELTNTVIDAFRGEHRFLSNFWPAAIVVEGVLYPSVEHAYQAAKCLNPAEKERLRTASTPGKAKRLSRKVALRPDWEAVKVGIMRELVRLKFRTHADLAAMLIATGEAKLVEGNTWGDRFWGVCRGEGANWLGRILMEVRAELREESPAKASRPAENAGRDESPTVVATTLIS